MSPNSYPSGRSPGRMPESLTKRKEIKEICPLRPLVVQLHTRRNLDQDQIPQKREEGDEKAKSNAGLIETNLPASPMMNRPTEANVPNAD